MSELSLNPEFVRFIFVFLATFGTHLAGQRLLRHAARTSARTNNIWDDSLIAAAQRPLPLLIWLTGIYFVLHRVHVQTSEPLLQHIAQIHSVSTIFCVAWFLWRLIQNVADNTLAVRSKLGEDVDRTTLDGLSKLFRIIVILASSLVALQTLGFSISGLIAFGGVGGLAVGLAAKDLLANFFGGLVVHLDRPFNVGETVRSPDRAIEGTVEHISWRHTRIRAPNMNLLYVPNALFTSIVVENPSRMSNRRIDQTIALRYEDVAKIEKIVEAIRTFLENHPGIDSEKTLIVAFDSFTESALNIVLRAYTRTTALAEFHTLKQEVLLHIARIIAEHEAQFANPTRAALKGNGLPG